MVGQSKLLPNIGLVAQHQRKKPSNTNAGLNMSRIATLLSTKIRLSKLNRNVAEKEYLAFLLIFFIDKLNSRIDSEPSFVVE
jgi:hypothetical protein